MSRSTAFCLLSLLGIIAFSHRVEIALQPGLTSMAFAQTQPMTIAPTRTFRGHRDRIAGVHFSLDGRQVISASADSTVRLWDVQSGEQIVQLENPDRSSFGNTYLSPDGTTLVTRYAASGEMSVWDLNPPQFRLTLAKGIDYNSGVFSADGQRFYHGASDQIVREYDPATGELIRSTSLSGYPSVVGEKVVPFLAAITPDSRYWICVHFLSSVISVWDTSTGAFVRSFQSPDGSITMARVTPDGQLLLATGISRKVLIWDLESGQPYRPLIDPERTQGGRHAISPNGRWVAVAADDYLINLWDIHQGERIAIFQGHEGGANVLNFSRDGRFLVSGSLDLTLRVWPIPQQN